MATLGDLAGPDGPLHLIELELDEGLAFRRLYGTRRFTGWLEKTLPEMKTGRIQSDLSPYEQTFERFRQFIVGEDLCLDDRRFAPLVCTPDTFVWEIKTPDVRVFGWFPRMDHFICCFGDHADHVKDHQLYSGYMSQVDYVRRNLPLDEPKSVNFRNCENVLSNAPRR